MKQGLFVSLEGGEGSGKTTTANIIKEMLEAKGYEVVLTREPGGVRVSEAIRSVIMDYNLHKKTEILLFAAARIEHLYQKIIPALNENKIVLCDRYIDSSIVYQGVAREGNVSEVKEVNYWATDHFLPDLTFFFDVEPKVALARICGEEREVNRFDQETLEFHTTIYDGYKKLASDNPKRIKKIDATQSQIEVATAIYNEIMAGING